MSTQLVTDIDAARVLAEAEDMARVVVDCGHVATPNYFLMPDWQSYADTAGKGVTGTPGYGTDPETGRRECFPCCGKADIERLKTAHTFVAYVSTDGRHVTNWPGTVLGRVTSHKVSKAARKAYVTVTDVHGTAWHGQGPAESGTYVRLRRRKGNTGK